MRIIIQCGLRVAITVLMLFMVSTNVQAGKDKYLESYNYKRGMTFYREKNYDEALASFKKEIGVNKKNGYAYLTMASIYLQKKDFSSGIQAINNALQFLPKKEKPLIAQAMSTRASLFAEMGDTTKAVADYGECIKLNPQDENYYCKRADLFLKIKDYVRAESDYKKVIELNQGNYNALMGIAAIRSEQKEWTSASKAYSTAISYYSGVSEPYYRRALCYIQMQDWRLAVDDLIEAISIAYNEDAIASCMDMVHDPEFGILRAKLKLKAARDTNNGLWYFLLGGLYEERKEFDSAIESYEESNKMNVDAETYFRICNCYCQKGDFERALRYVNYALNKNSLKDYFLSKKADILYELGRYDDAISICDAMIKEEPEESSAYFSRGFIKQYTNDEKGAVEDYDIVALLEPEYSSVYANRAKCYKSLNKLAMMTSDCNKVIELENTQEKYQSIPFAYQMLGMREKAMETMDAMMRNNADDGDTYYQAACVYSLLDRKDDAVGYLEKSLEKGFSRFGHLKQDKDLDNIREMDSYKNLMRKYGHSELVKSDNDSIEEKEHKKYLTNAILIEDSVDENGMVITPVESQSMTHSTMISDVDKESEADEVKAKKEKPAPKQPVERTIKVPFTINRTTGLRQVKCNINGLSLFFVIDEDTNTASLSQSEATFMTQNGYLKDKNVISNKSGDVLSGTYVNLRTVQFGGLKLNNVRAKVSADKRVPLTLGLGVLQRLGEVEIDDNEKKLKITIKR